MNKSKKVIKPNVVGGGVAIPLGNNFYFMNGRKHEQGGIDIGPNNKNGLEVEGGEVMQMGGKQVKVYSSLPILNGKSPAQLVMAGLNPDKVFDAQERFKDVNKLNDDGTKKAKFGKRQKAEIGLVENYGGEMETMWERVSNNNPTFKSAVQLIDPTGMTSVNDAYDSLKSFIKKPSLQSFGDALLNVSGAIPGVKYLTKLNKAQKFVKAANAVGDINTVVNGVKNVVNSEEPMSFRMGGSNRHFTINGNVVNKAGYVPSTGELPKASLGAVASIDKHVTRRDKNGLVTNALMADIQKQIDTYNANKKYRDAKAAKIKDEKSKKVETPKKVEKPVIVEKQNTNVVVNPIKKVSNITNETNIKRRKTLFDIEQEINRNPFNIEQEISRNLNEHNKTENSIDTISDQIETDIDTTSKKIITIKPVLFKPKPKKKTDNRRYIMKPINTKKKGILAYKDSSNKRLGGIDKRQKAEDGKEIFSPRGLGIQATMTKMQADAFDKEHPGEYNPYAQIFIDNFGDPTIYNPIMSDEANAKRFGIDRGYKGNVGLNWSMPELPNINLDNYFNAQEDVVAGGGGGGSARRGYSVSRSGSRPPETKITLEKITPPGIVVNPDTSPTQITFTLPKTETETKNKSTWWRDNGSDLISGLAKGGASLASYLINKNMLNDLKYQGQPIFTPAAKLKTKININPQIDAISRTTAAKNANVSANTASSKVRNARINSNYIDRLGYLSELYGMKENKETELINADKLNQQEITKGNIQAYNNWVENKQNFDNTIREKQSENAVSFVSNLASGVNDILTNRQKRKQFKQNIAAYMASHPNVSPELLESYGLDIFGDSKKTDKSDKIVKSEIKVNLPITNTEIAENDGYLKWLEKNDPEGYKNYIKRKAELDEKTKELIRKRNLEEYNKLKQQ